MILGDLAARREEVRRVFEDVFVPAARQTLSGTLPIPVVLAAPAPMSDYPLVDAALLVLQLAARECTSTDAGRLLRTPFIVGGQAERSQRALADRRLRDEQRDRWNWFEIERWAALTDCPTAADRGARRRTRSCAAWAADPPAAGPRTFTRCGRRPVGPAIAR